MQRVEDNVNVLRETVAGNNDHMEAEIQRRVGERSHVAKDEWKGDIARLGRKVIAIEETMTTAASLSEAMKKLATGLVSDRISIYFRASDLVPPDEPRLPVRPIQLTSSRANLKGQAGDEEGL